MLIEVEGVTSPAVTHALVVGVSHYPFLDGPEATPTGEQLGLANLNSAARSASEKPVRFQSPLDRYRVGYCRLSVATHRE